MFSHFSNLLDYLKIKEVFTKENTKSKKTVDNEIPLPVNKNSSNVKPIPIINNDFIPTLEEWNHMKNIGNLESSSKNFKTTKKSESESESESKKLESIEEEPIHMEDIIMEEKEDDDKVSSDMNIQEEKETPIITDVADVKLNDIPFYYLNDGTEWLFNEIPETILTDKTTLDIYLGLYHLNTSVPFAPFLTYLLEKTSNGQYFHFPHFQHTYISGDSTDILNVNCQNECKKKIFQHLNILPNENTYSTIFQNVVFKGYVVRGKDILALFIVEEMMSDMDLEESVCWATLHEMINTKKVNNISVHPFVSDWFLEHPLLLYIKDKYNNNIDIPYVLYLLEDVSDLTTSKKLEGIESLQNTERKYDIIPPMIRHPILEDIFLFSGELKVGANTSLESMEKISRYVVFITHTLYLLDTEDKMGDKADDNTGDKADDKTGDKTGDKAGEYDFSRFFQEKQKPYSSIYFQDTSSDIPIWGLYSVQFFGRL